MVDGEDRDGTEGEGRGLARERTELAWNRSGLAVAVTVAIVLRRLWPLSGNKEVVAGLLIASGAIIWAVGMRLGHRARVGADNRGALSPSSFRALTVGTLMLAAAGFVIAIFFPA